MTQHHPNKPGHAHHFDSAQQQFESSKQGMWLFLATEILLFSGLFCAYAVYRANHPEVFIYAQQFLDARLGGLNTVILICSSLTMAWGVRLAQLGKQKGLALMLALTMLLGLAFLGVKYIEYEHKWKSGLLWGKRYAPKAHHVDSPVGGEKVHADEEAEADHVAKETNSAKSSAAASDSGQNNNEGANIADDRPQLPAALQAEHTIIERAATSPGGMANQMTLHRAEDFAEPKLVHLFFGIYFTMTGLHALHLIAGLIILGWLFSER